MQTNDFCFINDEFKEKQALENSFCFDEDLLDELLKTNIESDNNKCSTLISDKINYSIMKLENAVKFDTDELKQNDLDPIPELDYESINQIMNEFFSQSFEMNDCIDFTSQKTTEFDPIIGNGLLDIKLI